MGQVLGPIMESFADTMKVMTETITKGNKNLDKELMKKDSYLNFSGLPNTMGITDFFQRVE